MLNDLIARTMHTKHLVGIGPHDAALIGNGVAKPIIDGLHFHREIVVVVAHVQHVNAPF